MEAIEAIAAGSIRDPLGSQRPQPLRPTAFAPLAVREARSLAAGGVRRLRPAPAAHDR